MREETTSVRGMTRAWTGLIRLTESGDNRRITFSVVRVPKVQTAYLVRRVDIIELFRHCAPRCKAIDSSTAHQFASPAKVCSPNFSTQREHSHHLMRNVEIGHRTDRVEVYIPNDYMYPLSTMSCTRSHHRSQPRLPRKHQSPGS